MCCNPMVKRVVLKLTVIMLVTAGCNFARQTPTPVLPTLTPSLTATISPTPTITPTPTTAATAAPTLTPTITLTPSETPLPTPTGFPTPRYSNDQWQTVTVPAEFQGGLSGTWFAFLSINERTNTTNLQTPEPSSELETLYLLNPSNGGQVPIIDLPVSTQNRVYWAPDGNKVLYFLEAGFADDGTQIGGLYLLNLSLGVSLRVFDISMLSPRGISDHYPVWSPDSTQFAMALTTEYAVDIFAVTADGSSFQNLTAHGSYDLWPAWSPDGRRLAFVSDRKQCPTWTPGEPDSCAALAAPSAGEGGDLPAGGSLDAAHISGNLYVLDVDTGSVRQITDMELDGPPTWISNLQIAFTTGLSDPMSAESHLWTANIQSGTVREITDPAQTLNLDPSWAPGGTQVLYQQASEPTQLVLKDANGSLISSTDQYSFPRFGFAADWSPGGEWVAFAGRNGQCPYGLIVARNDLTIVYGPATMPRACDPSYSPDGRWLAFAGIQFRPGVDDGRLDLFIAQPSGSGAVNYTGQLRGEIQLLGWVGSES